MLVAIMLQDLITAAPSETPSSTPTIAPIVRASLPTMAPIAPTPSDDDRTCTEYVEDGVSITATGYDVRVGNEGGCDPLGCLPEYTRDGVTMDVESRWSCKENVVLPGLDNCELKFSFDMPRDIIAVEVDFWKWDTRSRTLKVRRWAVFRFLRGVYNTLQFAYLTCNENASLVQDTVVALLIFFRHDKGYRRTTWG